MKEREYDRELARLIDHTLLKTDAKKADFDRACAEAKKYHYVCPMDHKPLRKIVVPVKKTHPAAKPAK